MVSSYLHIGNLGRRTGSGDRIGHEEESCESDGDSEELRVVERCVVADVGE